jgi:hypothetical protein
MKGMCDVAATIVVLILLVGCAATHQGRSVETSGFLGDYSQLQEGSGDKALLNYVNPAADFRQYNKIMMDPIKVYPGVGDSFFSKISPEDLQKMVNYLDAAIRKNLGESFTFVTDPGPGVMRFRIALTEANSSKVAIDVVSSVLPYGIALSGLKSAAVGRGSGIGQTSMEFEALDSQKSERLAAAVDRRVGNKYTGEFNKFSKWRATQAAFDYWAERLKVRLAELQNPGQTPKQ